MPAGSDGVTTAIIYVDTEGFESTGKSDAYDDRIFALSAIISSLLVRISPCHQNCRQHHDRQNGTHKNLLLAGIRFERTVL